MAIIHCNHDLKCILSGKAAKAAMMYITDYITKMDTKTYQLLSLLSRAVVKASLHDKNLNAVDGAKLLLHKCLTQFSQQQQIHVQQAARYLRGHGDSIKSHDLSVMQSGLLIVYVKVNYGDASDKTQLFASSEDLDSLHDCEPVSI